MDNNRYTYKPISRYIKIRYTLKDSKAYIIFHGRRIHFDNILRLHYPVMFTGKDGKLTVLSGYYDITNNHCFLVEIDSNGEYARFYEEIEMEEK